MRELREFIKALPSSSAQRVTQGSETLDELVVKEIEKQMDRTKERSNKRKKNVKMQVRPHLLYRVSGVNCCCKVRPQCTVRSLVLCELAWATASQVHDFQQGKPGAR